MGLRGTFCLCVTGVALVGCGTKPIQPSSQHFQKPAAQSESESSVPQPLKGGVILPPPKPADKVATYSVVVTNVPAQEILFALARDAKINLDIQAGIQGAVTINAINQTLPQILSRIAKQVDMRYELDNGTLTVMPDSPYLHSYKIDYMNMARDSEGAVSDSTQVGSGSSGGSAAGTSASSGNHSSLTIKNTSRNHFWETLTQNIKDILRETDKVLPEGSFDISTERNKEAKGNKPVAASSSSSKKKSVTKKDGDGNPVPYEFEESDTTTTTHSTFREAASVIANSENGIITVRATGKQHEKIQEFIDQVMTNARRQVLIEATIVEVQLSDNFKQGIDWSKALLGIGAKGFELSQTGSTGIKAMPGALAVSYINPTSKFGDVTASVQLLEKFGNVKVLSSPKLSVMNNQTAMLRVVENTVYFIVNSTLGTCTAPCTPPIAYTTTVNTVPVGFTMSLTPQINGSDTVLLNIRPSITRMLRTVDDPTPGLAFTNSIPQTSTREMESVLKIENNQIAVLGGLMEDRMDKNTSEIPLLGRIPLLGYFFQNRNDTTTKTELVIFLRPVVIKSASVDGDFREYRNNLPDQNFFHESASGKP